MAVSKSGSKLIAVKDLVPMTPYIWLNDEPDSLTGTGSLGFLVVWKTEDIYSDDHIGNIASNECFIVLEGPTKCVNENLMASLYDSEERTFFKMKIMLMTRELIGWLFFDDQEAEKISFTHVQT